MMSSGLESLNDLLVAYFSSSLFLSFDIPEGENVIATGIDNATSINTMVAGVLIPAGIRLHGVM